MMKMTTTTKSECRGCSPDHPLVVGAARQRDDEVVHHGQHVEDHLGTIVADSLVEQLVQHQRA